MQQNTVGSLVSDARIASVGPKAPALPISWPQRLVEILVAGAALLATFPVIAAIWLAIRITSKGNPLFFQDRMGLDTKPFKFVKFRTMYADARQRFPSLYAYNYSADELEALQFKVGDDPRVTPLGRWLRKSTLDELPNFWNVLKGDMALVGPRPEIPEMLQYYQGEYRDKFRVRPGITGLAQIGGRGRLKFFETAALDLEYARNRSFTLDLNIMIQTIWKIIMRDGAF